MNTIVVIPVNFAAQNYNFRYIINPMARWPACSCCRAEWRGSARLREAGLVPGTRRDDRRRRMETAGHADGADGKRPVPGRGAGAWVRPQRSRRNRGRDQGFQGPGRRAGLAGHRGPAVREAHQGIPAPRWRACADTRSTRRPWTTPRAPRRYCAPRRKSTPKVFVLGHSLGGYVAPRIADEDGKLAG